MVLWSKFLAAETGETYLRNSCVGCIGISFETVYKKICMLTRPQQTFLQTKIMELEQALFFNFSSSILKLPTSVINALHVDEVGQIWFMVKHPSQQLHEFDKAFQSRLDFYKKGKDFHLQVVGRCSIICDPEEMNLALHLSEKIKESLSTEMILLKMSVAEIFYFPHRTKMPGARIIPQLTLQPLTFIKTLRYIVKDIIPVLQPNGNPYQSRRNIHL